MILNSLELASFRKFRDPLRIDGFSPGFNIVVEPNESGKSTLLEALRAAFFIRYSAKTELVRSFLPIGDDVAPRIAVEFEIAGQPWKLEKQFLKAPFVRLAGPSGRRESDAAEDALQELLGFERGNNRGSDPETRGPLGMLWVEQATALSVESPNRIVRDSVRGVLEAEVGAVTGGRRFDAIRANVETAYSAIRTPRSGQSRGELASAEARVAAASAARQQAEAVMREYDHALSELELARARLRIVERDLVDPETAEQRRMLAEQLKLAESATLRSTAAEAQFGQADEVAKTIAARIDRLEGSERRVEAAAAEVARLEAERDRTQDGADQAARNEQELRAALEAARSVREQREDALSRARDRIAAFAKIAGAGRAIATRRTLSDLEDREKLLQADVSAAIGDVEISALADLERAAIEARARFEAGTVKVDFDLADGVELRVDGNPSGAASIDVLSVTRLDIGEAGSVLIRPPQGGGRSIEAELSAAEDRLGAKLRSLGVVSHAMAVARNERSLAAMRELEALRVQISVACPGDPTIGLAPGADALRAFVATVGEQSVEAVAPNDDIDALEAVLGEAKLAEAEAAGRHEDSRLSLSKAESELAAAVAALGAAGREAEAAVAQLRAIAIDGDSAALETAFAEAQRDRAAKLDALEAARAGAKSFDANTLRRRIENLDRATSRTVEERVDLTGKIAALDSTITREGTAGPAGHVAETREEEEAAIAARDRLQREADILEVLRAALTNAANEASRTFLRPVTTRAMRYVERLFPGSDVTFDENLGLSSVARGGLDEASGDLSRGTQEQLAILTRLAFADLLLEDKAPVSLILDDPLVYSDDARLETMTDILQEASARMQVILLTCRSKAFRHVEANRIALQ
ncbi:AAA family ATPase [Sphingomonas sp. OTU376]|uniref:AAA family ATPase n=1 Tax=Sphingomonas sp. OTU376 TaxID=3043863 RepID=UPI00313ECC91